MGGRRAKHTLERLPGEKKKVGAQLVLELNVIFKIGGGKKGLWKETFCF